MVNQYGDTVSRSYTQRIEALPERVFPLLCPVREAEWLDGWRCEMIHSESGVAEDGCVFRTEGGDSPETVWMVSRHCAPEGRVEFVRVTTGLVASRLRIQLERASGDATSVHIGYIHTPISPAGSAFIESHYSQPEFERAMVWWEKSMNHFLATGQILRKG